MLCNQNDKFMQGSNVCGNVNSGGASLWETVLSPVMRGVLSGAEPVDLDRIISMCRRAN